MCPLETLVQKAAATASSPSLTAEAEVARQMQICNACRYCEGFCAVFPAMTRRLEFDKADVHYLANLCHNCGACLHACQYAPPHEFAVNVPQAMAKVRLETYADYAWPAALGRLYRHNGLALALALTAGLALFLFAGLARNGTLWSSGATGNFYGIFPHNLMIGLFLPVFLWSLLALAIGIVRFWRSAARPEAPGHIGLVATAEAGEAVLTLKYLDGGHGEGCPNENDAYTLWRRRFHHFTFYGFMLCLAATSIATLYHYLGGWHAPYDLPSLPKLFGVTGGVALLIGTSGLWWMNLRRDPAHGDVAQKPMDCGFIALLFFISFSGLVLWLMRATPAMALLTCLHLGSVMALFALLPYSKLAHAGYRCAALLKYAIERRQPSPVRAGAE